MLVLDPEESRLAEQAAPTPSHSEPIAHRARDGRWRGRQLWFAIWPRDY